MLRVTVQKATNLPDVDFRGKSDPYAKLSFQGVAHKTDHIKDELNPVWNKALEWDLNGKPLNPDEKLTVVIKDYEKIGFRKVLGQCEVPLKELVRGKQKTLKDTYALKDGKENPTTATCELEIVYEPPAGAKDESGDVEDGGVGEEGEEGEEGDETEAGEEGEEGGEEGGAPGQPGRPRRKRKRRSRRGKRRWSDKVQDFQIRIKVIEGRQLPGNNIHPLVRITMSNQKRETRVCRSTNKPIYNESFVFNFHSSEAELFDDMFVIEAFNSKKMRSDALIGYFEADIGSIYEMRGHAFVRKWVLMTSPGTEGDDDDEGEPGDEEGGKSKVKASSLGGAPAGYVKVTAMVLGPGDEPPAKAKQQPKDNEEDDIESNCLMPMGVSRQPALFSVKIFQAEDIPQMDTGMGRSIKKFFKGLFGGGKEEEEQGAKGLVDPYLKLSFCGKEVVTSTKYQDDQPEFKEQLQIPLMFPSMCERVKLQIYDWDRVGNDDCIGTAFLSLSAMSGEGDEGFPPTFGPCFVNFYGSPREFSELPDENEALNKGIGEGVAYRGRALVELETTLGSDDIENEVAAVENEDIIRVQSFLRREKFKLFACLYDATMVKDVDGPVEFEVSIGNYGNKMDESVAPANTAPSNPVYDGCHYHYLPWGSEKPCVCVESFWEDIAFRLEPLNLLNKLCDRLETPLNLIKKALDAPTPPDDKAFVAMVTSLLDHLVSDCMKEQDRFVNEILKLPGHRNKLDNKIESLRTEELKLISVEATELKQQLEQQITPPPVDETSLLAPPPFEPEEVEMESVIGELDGFLQRLKDLAIEPQNSMPDVIIWMISGTERIAYYRIPAYDVMHFSNPDACGKLCGNTVELKLKYPGRKASNIKEHPEIPALVRVEFWLGLEKDQDHWTARGKSEGEFVVYAESYENEMKIGPKWFKKGCPRPGFSSADGDLELPLDKFVEPPGWKFLGEWEKKPELSVLFDKDAGRKSFVEEIYEQYDRNFPGGEFKAAKIPWTDAAGDDCPPKDEVQIPPGWKWTTQWQIDSNRAVDSEGWEYTVDISYGVYNPVPKAYYLSRRRRWVRRRDLTNPDNTRKQAHFKKLIEEGWEYAPIFTMKFHAKERKMDFVRRRRLMRKLLPESGGKLDPTKTKLPPLLRVQLKSNDAESSLILSPRMFVSFNKPHRFQLWAYVYQARDLNASDDSGMNDPFVRVAFANQSQVTETKMKTLCPTWDQTLIFNVEIYDSLENIQRYPPSVVMELFDKDQMAQHSSIGSMGPLGKLGNLDIKLPGKDDFLGRTEFKPLPKMHGIEGAPCKLLWHPITRGEDDDGEILAACELFLDEGAQLPYSPTPRDARGEILPVRDDVRPVLRKTVVEVLCWGVRNMKKFQLASVKSPSIQFEIGGEIIESDILTNAKKSPNFGRPVLPRKILNLPVEEMYTPPMNIRVHDNRTFGRRPTVAVHSIKSLNKFRIKTPPSPSALQIQVETPKGPTPPRTPQMGQPQAPGQAQPAQGPSTSTKDIQLVDAPPPPPPPAQADGSSTGTDQGAGQGEGQGMGSRSGSQIIPPSPGPAPRDSNNKQIPPPTQAPPKMKGPKKTAEERAKEPEEKFDWWSKYHASLAAPGAAPGKAKKLLALLSPDEADTKNHIAKYREKGYDQLTVFPKELERIDTFGGFQDVIASFELLRGKKKKRKSDDDEERQKVVGEFKGLFRIYPMPEVEGGEAELPETLFTNLPPCEPIECLVRVYIVSATDLQPQDPSGLADPYVVIQLGKKKFDTKENYKPNTLNPIFGKMFEFDTVIPLQKDLKISVMDYDLLSRDDLIGETMIDLEQRLFTNHYAKCGLPKSYCDTGPNSWRDHRKPMEMLKEWCDKNDRNFKFYKGKDGTPDRIVVGYRVFQLDEFEEFVEDDKPNTHLGTKHHRLALHVLNQCELVPEHVETRALKSNVQPNIEQGKIQLWVDVFPRNEGGILKASVDVTAREPTAYALRCIIWNTSDVIMEETSITGDQMSDIYVKAWLDREEDDKQRTDIHYRSMDGEGNFNWRMVFPFLYLPIEKKMVIRKKEHFWSLDYKEERITPRMLIQIWENDTFSYDDFLGKLELDLVKLPKPCASPGRCGGSRDPAKNGEYIDLFQQNSVQGWWACYQEGNDKPTGKVEMTLELVTENQAAAKPVGEGRDEPNQHPHLDEPNRPATSFLWFMSPFKTLKFIIWKHYKWYILGALLLLLIICIVVIFLYALPGYTAKKILGV